MSKILFGVFTIFSALVGCTAERGIVYVCRGVLTMQYQGDASSSSDSMALVVYRDYVKLEGNSYLLFIPNLVPPRGKAELGTNTLNICKSSSVTQIEFNSYGCDLEKNMHLPSGEVTEGTFNNAFRELVLTQYRKRKLSSTAENDASLREQFHYRRTGIYTCDLS